MEIFFLVEEAIEGGFNARAIGESIFTEADTIEELKINLSDAVQCHFDDPCVPKTICLYAGKENDDF